VVLQFTGELGVSQTKVAFVVQDGRTKELYVMDYDGANRPLTSDKSIALARVVAGRIATSSPYRGGQRSRTTRSRPAAEGLPGVRATWEQHAPPIRRTAARSRSEPRRESRNLSCLDARHLAAAHHERSPAPQCHPVLADRAEIVSGRSRIAPGYVMDHEGGTSTVHASDGTVDCRPGRRRVIGRVRGTYRGGYLHMLIRWNRYTAGGFGGSNENPRWSPEHYSCAESRRQDGTARHGSR
jgi:hypothetical protein